MQAWLSDGTGIGAGIDSFYEYALKWCVFRLSELLFEWTTGGN